MPPPIDINLIRADKGGEPDIVQKSEERRFHKKEDFEALLAMDKDWRQACFKKDKANEAASVASKAIAAKKKNKEDASEEIKQAAEAKGAKEQAAVQESKIHALLEAQLAKIGNIVHDSVPVSDDEANNKVERTWGEVNEERKFDGSLGNLHHHHVMLLLDAYDPEPGANLAGHRGYFLKGPGVLLNMALQNYGIQFLLKRGYTPMMPPFFMKKKIMSETAELDSFDQDLYKVSNEKGGKEIADDDKCYLIATSEQPISAYHRGEWVPEPELPLQYAGISTCFRKEAGAAGRDMWGIFRVHQFEKVEQFVLCKPEASWEKHEEMIGIAEEFYKSLELPYRVVNIVSGALNNAAAKKYDLEAWFPGYGTYRELVSCSNCTDYQARALGVRCGATKKTGAKATPYVHMLNATLCATERTMCCIVENYQTEKGVRVPAVLQPFMGGIEFLDFKPAQIEKHLKRIQKQAKEFAAKTATP